MSDIKKNYFDALFFASSTITEKQKNHLAPVELKLIIKLIHYSSKDEVITWSSKNINLHTCIPIGSIDKSLCRLKEKGFINVVNTQLSARHVSREITINWSLIEDLDNQYSIWLENQSKVVTTKEVETKVETKEVETKEDLDETSHPWTKTKKTNTTQHNKLIDFIKSEGFGINDTEHLINMVKSGELTCIIDIKETTQYYPKTTTLAKSTEIDEVDMGF